MSGCISQRNPKLADPYAYSQNTIIETKSLEQLVSKGIVFEQVENPKPPMPSVHRFHVTTKPTFY